MARLSILKEFEDLHRVARYKPGAIYLLFCVPVGCAVFLFTQYVLGCHSASLNLQRMAVAFHRLGQPLRRIEVLRR